jgi:hypothetical protein
VSSRDPKTYGSIHKRYDAWQESEAQGESRPRLRRSAGDDHTDSPLDEGTSEMTRTIQAAIGICIGLALLALAALAFSNAAYWGEVGRDGAKVGFRLAGFFLTVAGLGGILATWNHNFRVLAGKGGSHH